VSGVEPFVFHLSGEQGWRGGEQQLGLLVAGLRVPGRLFVVHGSELHQRFADISVPLAGMGWRHPRAAWQVRRQLAQTPCAVLHAHSSKGLETALWARRGRALPLIVSRRTAFPVNSGWKYRAADAVVAVSEAARRQLLAAGVRDERIVTIPDAVDADRFARAKPQRLGVPEHAALVLCAAAFSTEKGHADLMHAWAKVESQRGDAHLALCGVGELRDSTSRLADRLGLQKVHFAGWRSDLADCIAGCDIAVLASRSEGLSSFLCEAQWCGKPVVATDAGGIPEAVADGATALLAPIGDADSLARHLLHLIDDRDLRRRFGAAAAARARERFDPGRVVGAHEALYCRLARPNAR
jgi:glycosyltransferase involved in cell wall biosynthesis